MQLQADRPTDRKVSYISCKCRSVCQIRNLTQTRCESKGESAKHNTVDLVSSRAALYSVERFCFHNEGRLFRGDFPCLRCMVLLMSDDRWSRVFMFFHLCPFWPQPVTTIFVQPTKTPLRLDFLLNLTDLNDSGVVVSILTSQWEGSGLNPCWFLLCVCVFPCAFKAHTS